MYNLDYTSEFTVAGLVGFPGGGESTHREKVGRDLMIEGLVMFCLSRL